MKLSVYVNDRDVATLESSGDFKSVLTCPRQRHSVSGDAVERVTVSLAWVVRDAVLECLERQPSGK